ncbi:MAG: phosphoribosylglycinamide formyltransferase [Actinobacteria bacterium]|uniref:phosphoribosylglycinamide formyltransferase 1 n=1 Tax=freshwater metagenome TaxID=449393 RepID=A0A6J6ESP0_9ZZZZ|nr:phosphoribosylglycinamide formyltransferase [Actinomycetota bacterium]MTA89571.1 phosphoribosylglycinamide formyltransferase [Actinomycetota bacterium]
MLTIVALISGSGSNLRALLEACDSPLYPAKVRAVGADRPAAGLEHAELFGVSTFVLEPNKFSSKEQWADLLLHSIQFHKPDLVVLAGFMRVLPKSIIDALPGKIINIHPSLLPAFPGAHAVRDALAAGVTMTGATVHIVDAGIDTGPVIRQQEVAIPAGISETELHERIKEVEKTQLVGVIKDIAEGRINLAEVAN